MKIAVIGVKGIPKVQGGIEKHAQELYPRLVARGHEVTVFCRRYIADEEGHMYKGVRIRNLPSINTKHLDTITNALVASILSIMGDYDIIHYHAIGPALLSFIPRIKKRTKVITTVHGLDWQREKWGCFAKASLKLGEKSTAMFSDTVITVSRDLTNYFQNKYPKCGVQYIPNGICEPKKRKSTKALSSWGIQPMKYILYAGRLVPEKGCHNLIKAFGEVKTNVRLVIAGAESHSRDYALGLKNMAKDDPRIVFTGFVSGTPLEELFSNALGYVLPSELEGLPISLLEALSYGLPSVCSDIPPHVEVSLIGEDKFSGILLFESGNIEQLRDQLHQLFGSRNKLKQEAVAARPAILREYNWDRIARLTEDTYLSSNKEAILSRMIEKARE